MSDKNNKILQQFLNQINNCDVIVELGANVGIITKQLIKYNKPIHAFEPEPEAFNKLSLIKSEFLNIYNKAAWLDNGKSILFRHNDWENSKSHTSSTLNKSKSNIDSRNTIICETIDIADFIKSINGKVLIKMDVEGSEYEIINHLLYKKAFKNINMIFCEFHPNKIKRGYLKQFLLKFRLMISGKLHMVKNWF
tara:strand:- start:592 stop:1173 length:582 start_codon:yes stop_codon:yes gene_type:complete